MPINNESLNRKLYDLLKTQGYNPVPKDSEGQTSPVPDEADVFKFTFTNQGEEFGDAWITIDSSQKLVVYYDDSITDSDDETAGNNWTNFLRQLKSWAQRRQLSFNLKNKNHLSSDMAQRTHMKKKEQIAEGYYPMGKNASYSDAVPTVKIVLQHTRQIQEGEQRYRNVARIFLENQQGERILAPTTRPGIAQVYARHLAEGGVPNDERWNHIKSLCEEYSQMAGFVRAVRGNQFNESAQRLVTEGINHYNSLRESLGKLRGHRGYNAYFESWTPTLMETDSEDSNLNELFVQETLDPRIESVMPILSKLSKNLGEMKEVSELEEWANKLVESPKSENKAHEDSEEDVESVDLDEDKVEEGYDPSWDPESRYHRVPSWGDSDDEDEEYEKERQRELDDEDDVEEGVAEGLDPEKRSRLDDLIDQFSTSVDPEFDSYNMDDDYLDPDDILAQIRSEFGDKIASQVEAGAHKMHFPRDNHVHGYDPLGWKKPVDRITKAGKMYKQDSDFRKNTIKSRYKLSGKSATEDVAEDLSPEQEKVGQLGPTEKVGPKGAVGKLVGANESIEHDPLNDIKRLLGK